ncbi:MAG: HD domain-containing protein [Floccifex porci]|uniref:HD domain-containing protein n=1 Tax=Floccifex porci TaxID=2606629 RepID=UPI003EFC168A
MTKKEKIRYYGKDILDSKSIQIQKQCLQHGKRTVFEHSLAVALMCLTINEFLHLKLNERRLIRGALLHDYFLYDWHVKDKSHRLHGFRHPYFALENARKEYELDPVLEDMIVKHMFPLIPIPPKYRESWVLCIADKICASKETILRK